MIILFPECLVKNKTIIGLKFHIIIIHSITTSVKNKTIIGLKFDWTSIYIKLSVKNKTIIGLKFT